MTNTERCEISANHQIIIHKYYMVRIDIGKSIAGLGLSFFFFFFFGKNIKYIRKILKKKYSLYKKKKRARNCASEIFDCVWCVSVCILLFYLRLSGIMENDCC